MNNWETIGVIVAILTLAGSVMFHLFKTTWWMATLTASINTMTLAITKIQDQISKFDGEYSKKEDTLERFGRIQASVDAAHRRIDEIKK